MFFTTFTIEIKGNRKMDFVAGKEARFDENGRVVLPVRFKE